MCDAKEWKERRLSDSIRIPMDEELFKFIYDLSSHGVLKFGENELPSGVISPIYLNIRVLSSFPEQLVSNSFILFSVYIYVIYLFVTP